MTDETRLPAARATRRLFLWSAGAALSAPAVAAAAGATTDDGRAALEARLAALEDRAALRTLHEDVLRHVNTGARDALAALFVSGEAVGLDATLRALSPDASGEQDRLDVAADGARAEAHVTCMARTETPIASSCTLAQMARAQGDGMIRRTERLAMETACVKVDGAWKIERLELRPL